MILIWRGWGLLAVVALFPMLASCGGLITVEPFWIFMLAWALSMLFAGGVCVYCGTRWNRRGVEHSFYFVPLQVWGWIYLAIVGLFALAAIGGAFKQGLDQPGRLIQAIAGAVGSIIVVVMAVFLRRLASSNTDMINLAWLDDPDQNSKVKALELAEQIAKEALEKNESEYQFRQGIPERRSGSSETGFKEL